MSKRIAIICGGSSNATPFIPVGDGIEGLWQANQRINEQLKAARSTGIVGARAVGTELAGEIAHAKPDKKFTLVSDLDRLFPTKPEKLGTALSKKLRVPHTWKQGREPPKHNRTLCMSAEAVGWHGAGFRPDLPRPRIARQFRTDRWPA
ncbi:hypothetical protein [Tropicimonas sediminicola]|uniref:hypothetical protein n=1 Tax=Tropicimonas sediminicola TaxID=1031541 RepID=UPI003182F0A2